MIWATIASYIPWEWIASAVAAIGVVLAAWWRGRRSGAVARDLRAARANDKAHQRMNQSDAEMDRIDSDADRVKRLRDYADRHGV